MQMLNLNKLSKKKLNNIKKYKFYDNKFNNQ